MDQASGGEQSRVGKSILGLFIAIGSLVLLYIVLGWFDNTTELSPDHDHVLQACFAIAGLSGLAAGIVGIRKSKGITFWRRAPLALGLSLLGFLSVFLASGRTASIVEGLIDFPPGKTRSYTTLLLISRAYQTHGKGRSWNIQTTPIWSNLDITGDDYEFMLTHRRAEDNTRDPDEISSNGYFCAQVTIQQSGNALRVLHAGSHKLPKGSVVICPSSTGR
jgi:hypothetical protein